MSRQLPEANSLWLYPLHSIVLIFNLICSVLLFVSIRGGLFGVWLGIFVVFWVAKYAFILLEHRARGFDTPPVLGADKIAILADMRPWKLLVFTGLFAALHVALVKFGLSVTAQVVLGVYLFLLPAQIVILSLEDSFFDMFNMFKLFRFVSEIGPVAYAFMLAGLGGGYAALILATRSDIGLLIFLVVFQYILYLVFSALGRTLYIKRHAVGFVAHRSPEREEQELEEWRDLHYGRFLADMYSLRKSGRFQNVAERIRRHAEDEGGGVDIYAWFYRELGQWQDLGIRALFARYYMEALLKNNDPVTALNVLDIEKGVSEDYFPDDPGLVLLLGKAAAGDGRFSLARVLLEGFDERFPGSSKVCDAMIEGIVLLSDKFQDFDAARSLLRKLCSQYPDAYHDLRLKPWLETIL